MEPWLYKGKPLKRVPKGYYGFVYVITDDHGKKYWGKKAFTHRTKKKVSKKRRKVTRKRIEIVEKDSGWLNYWGSSKPLLEYIRVVGGTRKFSREVLKLCKDKQSLTYWETYYLFKEKVLFNDSWNGHILNRFFQGKIHR